MKTIRFIGLGIEAGAMQRSRRRSPRSRVGCSSPSPDRAGAPMMTAKSSGTAGPERPLEPRFPPGLRAGIE